MTKLAKLRRCLALPRNPEGRDLVVGDLHGHRTLFEKELERLCFDPRRDRVLAVGDLTDRGPESLATLSLIEEPWFHAVLGNHELMLLNYLGYYASRLHSRKAFAAGGGEWINEAMARHRKSVMRLADRIAALPLVLQVDGDLPFHVAHAELPPMGAGPNRLADKESIGLQEADGVTSARENFNAALKLDLLSLPFEQHAVQISPAPIGQAPITYVGHSPVRRITVHNSLVWIDQGVCAGTAKRPAATPPTVLDHRRFARWLGGVAAVRGGVPAAARERAGAAPVLPVTA